MPELIGYSDRLSTLWSETVDQAERVYALILEELESNVAPGRGEEEKRERRRQIRSAARSVLPEATETRIVFSANARAIRHFLTLRGGIVSDLEMRRVSAELLALVMKEAPAVFDDFEITEADGFRLVRLAVGLEGDDGNTFGQAP